MWAGLLRMGWVWPPLRPTLAALHGPLMVSGFLGTLIGLERAVAMRRSWTLSQPAADGRRGLLLILALCESGGHFDHPGQCAAGRRVGGHGAP